MQLQVDEIQGIILHGYGALDDAAFLLLAIDDPARAKSWLGGLELRDSKTRPEKSDTCVNIAFTLAGLRALGLPEEQVTMFSGEFLDGMTGSDHRRRALGDHGDSAPEHWQWGKKPDEPDEIHILLMLYARDKPALSELVARHEQAFAGVRLVKRLDDALTLDKRKEHFGFRDGISQPIVQGHDKETSPGNTIAAGEFVFGYENAYGQFTARPTVVPKADPQNILPPAPDDPKRRDFAKNGSFLVFRQLKQNVHAFWHTLAEKGSGMLPGDPVQACVALASKMVGRWPSGKPLVKSPHADPGGISDDNDFMYFGNGDADGLKCPIGSHLRRSNPRDSLDPHPGTDRSIEVGKRHRIIRRGRAYGPPAAASMDPAEIIGQRDDHVDRGLHFICFNTQLGRQFEFIQHTWVNGTKFDGMYDDDDPIAGDRGSSDVLRGGTFSTQQEPVRKRITGLPRFVTTVGGAYFFMPSVSAVRYLASLR